MENITKDKAVIDNCDEMNKFLDWANRNLEENKRQRLEFELRRQRILMPAVLLASVVLFSLFAIYLFTK